MSANEKPYAGRFVWHDILTKDAVESREFLRRVFPWKTIVRGVSSTRTGTLFMTRSGDVGGLVAIDRHSKLPTFVMPYIGVDDLEASVEEATGRGAKNPWIALDKTEPGRAALLVDPQGAFFSTWTDTGERPGGPASPPTGQFVWHELHSPSPDSAAAFYGRVLGWSAEPIGRGNGQRPRLMKRDGKPVALVRPQPTGTNGSARWISFVAVDDLDESIARATKSGAAVVVGPEEVVGVGRCAVVRDRARFQIGLIELA